VLVHLREPDFWRYFFWVEHVQRFTADDAQHAAPFWYYVAYLPLTGWPWILLLPAAAIGLRRTEGDRDFVAYLIAWAWLPFLFFSVSKGKLATYILPCFAPLSILLAAGLERYVAAGYTRAWRVAAGIVALAFVAVLALVAAAQGGVLGAVPYGVGEGGRLATLVAGLVVGAAGGIVAVAARRTRVRIDGVAVAGAALLVPLQFALPQQALDNFAPSAVVARYARGANTIVVSDAPLFGTAAWALKRTDVYVASPGEIEYGLSYPEARERLLDGPKFGALLAENRRRGSEVVLVCVPSTEQELKPWLPSDARREQQGNVIVWRTGEVNPLR
jgi:4-amino-4-deoxy-L-arabinose transferase